MASEVGSGQVAIVPTFKGFRKSVSKETDAAAKDSDKGFRRAFSKTGTESGKETGRGFKKAFEGQSIGFTAKATRELEQNVAKAARALSQARLKQLDQVGKVRVAEAQLAEAQQKHAAGSSQVVRAMERLQSETRKLEAANENTTDATNELRTAQQNLASAADRAGDEMESAGRRSATRFRSGFREIFAGSFLGTTLSNLATSIVSNLTAAVGRGLREGIEFAISSVDVASDLNESVNAVQVAYGGIADQILAMGDTSAETFGLATRDLNKYSVQFSAFAKGIAGDGGDVAGTFRSILGRATDFASVMNLDVAEALGLFQSGLAGETEPLRRFGIDLSAATVEAYAYANGIAASGDELTEAQKLQARYGALLEQTAQVQGDFANTSDELANKNRINAASWDNLQAKIGAAFLPVASELADLLGDKVIPIIEDLVDEHGPALTKAFEEVLPALSELAVELLPELPGLLQSAADTIPKLVDAGARLAPIIVWIAEATGGWWSTLSGFFAWLAGDTTAEEFVQELLTIPGPVGDVWRGVKDMAFQVGAWLGTAQWHVQNFSKDVDRNIKTVIAWFRDLPARIGETVQGIGSWLYNSGKELIQGFINGINAMFKPVGDAVSGLLNWVGGFFPNSPAKRGPLSGAGWTRLGKSGSAVVEQFTSGFGRPDVSAALAPLLLPAVEAAPSRSAVGSMSPSKHVTNNVTLVNPVVRDPQREAWEAAQIIGSVA